MGLFKVLAATGSSLLEYLGKRGRAADDDNDGADKRAKLESSTAADLCPFAPGTKKPPRLKYPDGRGKAGHDEHVAAHKAEVTVETFGHRLFLYLQSNRRAAVDPVLEIVEALPPLAAFPGKKTQSKQSARCQAFGKDVCRVTKNPDFFKGWHARYDASRWAFLGAVDTDAVGVLATLRAAALADESSFDPDEEVDFGSRVQLRIATIIELAGGIGEVTEKLETKPDGETEVGRIARIAAAFALKPGTVQHLVFAVCAVCLSGDRAISTELAVINGLYLLHGCHMRAALLIYLALRHKRFGLFKNGQIDSENASSPFGISYELVKALAFIATLDSEPSTIANHLCYYNRNAFARAFGPNLDAILEARYGDDVDIVRDRLAEGTGRELGRSAAFDTCCLKIAVDPSGRVDPDTGEKLYALLKNRIHDTQLHLLCGYPYNILREIVLDIELEASAAASPGPSRWPAGVWDTLEAKGAFVGGTGRRQAYFDFVDEASALFDAYPGFDARTLFEAHGLDLTRERVARCDGLTPSAMYENPPLDVSTPLGDKLMRLREVAQEYAAANRDA